MRKVVVIDADGLVYHSSKDTLMESLEVLDEKINNLFNATGATEYVMCISRGKYFRHGIFPEYKASRGKYQTQLKWVKTLKSYLEERWGAMFMYHVEADDLVAFYHHKLRSDGVDVIIASPDKDILQSIPGKHFNYTYRLEEKDNPNSVIKGWWVETSEEDAENFEYFQLIVGDTSDGIKGVEGRGKVFFEKAGAWDYAKVLETYQEKYGKIQGIYEFQKNQRLIHMLTTKEDFLREVGELPPDIVTHFVNLIDKLHEIDEFFEIDEELF